MMMSTSTRAIVQYRYGSADQMQLGEMPLPPLGKDDVLVRVRAAGMDRGTWHLMTGRPYAVRLGVGLRGPRNRVPGRDLAGTVVAVGPAVTRVSVGEDVYGIGRGSFAEYTAAREDRLVRMPAGMTAEEAAVVPVSGLAALKALTDVAHLQAGQRVLITGASGGVGSFAVQIAVALGAEVTGVARTEKVGFVRGLGAHHVIDRMCEDFAVGRHRYDVILDMAGNPSLSRLRRALTPAGTAVIGGGEHGGSILGLDRQLRALVLSPFVRQRLTMLISRESAAELERLTALIESGAVRPYVDRTFPLERVQDAMCYLEAGHVSGKLAIRI